MDLWGGKEHIVDPNASVNDAADDPNFFVPDKRQRCRERAKGAQRREKASVLDKNLKKRRKDTYKSKT
jgi:hypothetical protein